MKLYRSIEFSRLAFLVDENHQKIWKEMIVEPRDGARYSNWWLKKENDLQRRQIIKNVMCDSKKFFEKSADFNSKVGGRFNPEKSFGAIYTSTNPTLSMLEVLYHVFDSSLGLYKDLKRSSDKLVSSFNVPVPEYIEIMIIALELDADDKCKIEKLCADKIKFKKLCEKLGFYRYIDSYFNEDFLFGNDYEITRIIGCSFHEKNNLSLLGVPSARVGFVYQGDEYYNVVIPENRVDCLNLALTGKFREYKCKMFMTEEDARHRIEIKAVGRTEKSSIVYLQNKPSRNNDRVIEFSQVKDVGEDRKKYSREVRLQRFVL